MKRHLITVTRILWGKPLHSVFVLLWIIARTWYICITKIAVKHILAVVVNVDGVFAALLTHIAFANYFLGDKKGKRKSVWSSCTITNLRRLHKIDSWRRLSVYALPICCISKYFECYEAPGYMLTRKKQVFPEEIIFMWQFDFRWTWHFHQNLCTLRYLLSRWIRITALEPSYRDV